MCSITFRRLLRISVYRHIFTLPNKNINLKGTKGLSHLNAFYTSALFKQTFRLFIVSPFVLPLSYQFDEAYIEELLNRKNV